MIDDQKGARHGNTSKHTTYRSKPWQALSGGSLEYLYNDIDSLTPRSPTLDLVLFWAVLKRGRVTQAFMENRAYYSGLDPRLIGHDGVDTECHVGDHITSTSYGTVTEVGERRPGHPYGVAIRVRHTVSEILSGQARTIELVYAHLSETRVEVGDTVIPGVLLGLGGVTGNVKGTHLHVTFKVIDATRRDETPYGFDIVDQTPYMITRASTEAWLATIKQGLNIKSSKAITVKRLQTRRVV